MKAKKPTKKQIVAELRSLDCTRIHRIAAKCGVNANVGHEVKFFCFKNSPSKKLYYKLSAIISARGIDRIIIKSKCGIKTLPIIDTMRRMMRYEINCGYSSYSKILIEGNDSIYWASPVYRHQDYNKSRAMPNTERNREVMKVINNYLAKHGIK